MTHAPGHSLWSLLLLFMVIATSAQERTTYEWEDWDFYRILGINEPATADTVAIRKAYRKQAKQFHPDKLMGRNVSSDPLMASENNTTLPSNSTLKTTAKTSPSKEEINARFARIAEAYQVLADPEQRRDYDQYLTMIKQHGSSGVPSFATYQQQHAHQQQNYDPFRMFEDDFEDESDHNQHYYNEARFSQGGAGYASNHHHEHPPMRVQERQEVLTDPSSGQQTLRIVQIHEYSDGFYRVWAQEFVDDWNPYQREWAYRPLQMEPYLLEEGYATGGGHHQPEEASSSHILWPDEVLAENMVLQRIEHEEDEHASYRAGVTPTCELCILRRGKSDPIWTTDPHWQPRPDCRVELRGPHLTLVTSTNEVVWHSDVPERELKDTDDLSYLFTGAQPPQSSSLYIARLDSDGSLSVYRLERPKRFWSHLLQQTQQHPRLVQRVVRIAGSLASRNQLGGRFPPPQPGTTFEGKNSGGGGNNATLLYGQLKCIWSSGPAGCSRVGRATLHLGKRLFKWIPSLMDKLDSFLERVL